ncbi:hypothetical protein Tco_0974618 [Tanacetum coccineum]|uniref:MAK10-like protein n=1 Tax=Tanacetum coccineum TaxID=301880 RepID=A0ABQ5EC97_9ASTR
MELGSKTLHLRQSGKERCHVEADHALAFDQSFFVVSHGSYTCIRCSFLFMLILHIAFAACICTLHLQLAFASKHLHIAFADCICTLHLYFAFAACICKQAFAHCTCTLHLQAKWYEVSRDSKTKRKGCGIRRRPNREGGREERNSEGGRPSEFGAKRNKIQGTNLPPLLAAHLGRNENGQPLQSSLTSVYGGHRPSTNSIFSSCYLFRNPFSSTIMGDENLIRTLGDYSKPSHEGYKNTIELPVGNNVVPLRSDTIRTAKLRNDILMFQQVNNIKKNLFLKHGLILRTYSKKSLIMASTFGSRSKSFMTMSLLSQDEPLTNGRWDFVEPVKAISLPQDVPSTSDRCLIELENQVQHLMEAHIAPMQLTQVNKITSSCEICSGPHDTQYCMENPEQAFVEYVSSCTDEAGGKWYTFKPEQNNFGDTYNPSWKSHPNLRWRQP